MIRGMPAPVFNNVTTITTMGLDAAAQPWISGRLGEVQPSFAAYLRRRLLAAVAHA